jgi:succinylglutamate desuccinylase
MLERIKQEVSQFRDYLNTSFNGLQADVLSPDIIALSPPSPAVSPVPGKTYALTLMAVTHGNEVGGIAVLNHILQLIHHGVVQVPFPMVIGLANPQASLANERFLERDLNRSFGRQANDTHEDRRARQLEKVLAHTGYFVDFHQTIEPSLSPFMIFPYQQPSYKFARQIAPDVPIVTHWGTSFSKGGACSDEFVNRNEGVGVTIELGHKGFSPYQEGIGLRVALQAIQTVKQRLLGETLKSPTTEPEIYTWAQVLPFPDGDAGLDEGWYNFRQVEKGQRLGLANGQEIRAEASGPILFPKYVTSPEQTRPKEICRIMKRVRPDELGKS